MAYCANCGVELESGHLACPLCRRPLSGDGSLLLPADQAYARERETVLSPADQARRYLGIVVLMTSGLTGIAALVCILVDLLYSGGGWSRFVVAALALVWWLGFTPRLFFGHRLVVFLADVGIVGLFLLAIDLLLGFTGWSLVLGLPIVAGTALLVVLMWLALRLYRRKIGFVLATLFGAAAMLCLVIDAAVSRVLGGHISLLWSLIALASLFPLTLSMVILQLVYFRSGRIQRYLHW
jgi:hypothetical protein